MLLRTFTSEDRGTVAIEYVLIAAMTAILAIAALTFFGGSVSGKYSSIETSIADAT